jgi:hypothetical protein
MITLVFTWNRGNVALLSAMFPFGFFGVQNNRLPVEGARPFRQQPFPLSIFDSCIRVMHQRRADFRLFLLLPCQLAVNRLPNFAADGIRSGRERAAERHCSYSDFWALLRIGWTSYLWRLLLRYPIGYSTLCSPSVTASEDQWRDRALSACMFHSVNRLWCIARELLDSLVIWPLACLVLGLNDGAAGSCWPPHRR